MKFINKLFLLLGICLLPTVVCGQETQYVWRYRSHQTDCTVLTDGKLRDLCFEADSANLYKCNATTCTSPSDWVLSGGGGVETDPIYSAWDKTTGISIQENQISDLAHYNNTQARSDTGFTNDGVKITSTTPTENVELMGGLGINNVVLNNSLYAIKVKPGVSYFYLPDNEIIDFSTDMTISLWIKMHAYTPTLGHVFRKENAYSLGVSGSGKLGTYMWTPGIAGNWDLGTTTLPIDGWCLIGLSHNTTTGTKVWYNGTLDGSLGNSGSISNSASVLYFGSLGLNDFSYPLNATIDEINLYPKELNATEWAACYNDGLGRHGNTTQYGIVSGYHLNEGGNVLEDFVGTLDGVNYLSNYVTGKVTTDLPAGHVVADTVKTNNLITNISYGSLFDLPPYLDTNSLDDLISTTQFSGDVSGAYNSIVVTDNSHNHTTAAGWTSVSGKVYPIVISDNIGIGTTAPQYNLDVNGSINGDFTHQTKDFILDNFNTTGIKKGTRLPNGATMTGLYVCIDGGTNFTAALMECDSEGINCVNSNTTDLFESGYKAVTSFTDSIFDVGDFWALNVTDINGPINGSITIQFDE